MNELQIYNHPDFGGMRTLGDADDPRFCLSDVCKPLELRVDKVVARLKDDPLSRGVISKHPIIDALGRTQQMYFVNEDGLYDVILDSRKPAAKKFRKWITSEVLPNIRKHGMYLDPNAPIDPRFLRRIADEIEARDKKILELDTQVTTLSNENAEMKPKVDYYDKVMSSAETLSTTLIAHAYGMSAIIFNRKLEELKIIRKVNNVWELYQKYVGKGYMVDVVKEREGGFTFTHTYWTHKGRMFLYSELKKHGIFPTREQNNPQLALFEGDAS